MPRWEICEIVATTRTVRGSGLFADEKTSSKYAAIAFTVDGERRIVAESEESEGGRTMDTVGDFHGATQLRRLIARLGVDGWEPMPLAYADGSYFRFRWYFKRLLADA